MSMRWKFGPRASQIALKRRPNIRASVSMNTVRIITTKAVPEKRRHPPEHVRADIHDVGHLDRRELLLEVAGDVFPHLLPRLHRILLHPPLGRAWPAAQASASLIRSALSCRYLNSHFVCRSPRRENALTTIAARKRKSTKTVISTAKNRGTLCSRSQFVIGKLTVAMKKASSTGTKKPAAALSPAINMTRLARITRIFRPCSFS